MCSLRQILLFDAYMHKQRSKDLAKLVYASEDFDMDMGWIGWIGWIGWRKYLNEYMPVGSVSL